MPRRTRHPRPPTGRQQDCTPHAPHKGSQVSLPAPSPPSIVHCCSGQHRRRQHVLRTALCTLCGMLSATPCESMKMTENTLQCHQIRSRDLVRIHIEERGRPEVATHHGEHHDVGHASDRAFISISIFALHSHHVVAVHTAVLDGRARLAPEPPPLAAGQTCVLVRQVLPAYCAFRPPAFPALCTMPSTRTDDTGPTGRARQQSLHWPLGPCVVSTLGSGRRPQDGARPTGRGCQESSRQELDG